MSPSGSRILVIDPGPHVGAATWSPASQVGSTMLPAEHVAWEWTPEQFYVDIESWVTASGVVVVEDYRIGGPRAREGNATIEQIGICRYLCRRWGVEFVTQAPGAYRFAGADKLKKLGWYTRGSDHARSASGHLVLYMVENGLLQAEELLT